MILFDESRAKALVPVGITSLHKPDFARLRSSLLMVLVNSLHRQDYAPGHLSSKSIFLALSS